MKKKILLVDDDANLLAMLGDFLESEGYEVAKAESGEKALAMLRLVEPDLIVLDMSMPGIGGMGVIDRLQQPDGSMSYPVLVLTARARMAEYFADKQVDGFIAKPCDPEDLAMEVSRIVFQRSGRAPAELAAKKPVILLGEPDTHLQGEIYRGLLAAGYDARNFSSGAELLEAAVLEPPAMVVLRLALGGQSAATVATILRQMPRTREIAVIVYGINAADAGVDQIAELDDRHCSMVPGTEAAVVVRAVLQAFGR